MRALHVVHHRDQPRDQRPPLRLPLQRGRRHRAPLHPPRARRHPLRSPAAVARAPVRRVRPVPGIPRRLSPHPAPRVRHPALRRTPRPGLRLFSGTYLSAHFCLRLIRPTAISPPPQPPLACAPSFPRCLPVSLGGLLHSPAAHLPHRQLLPRRPQGAPRASALAQAGRRRILAPPRPHWRDRPCRPRRARASTPRAKTPSPHPLQPVRSHAAATHLSRDRHHHSPASRASFPGHYFRVSRNLTTRSSRPFAFTPSAFGLSHAHVIHCPVRPLHQKLSAFLPLNKRHRLSFSRVLPPPPVSSRPIDASHPYTLPNTYLLFSCSFCLFPSFSLFPPFISWPSVSAAPPSHTRPHHTPTHPISRPDPSSVREFSMK